MHLQIRSSKFSCLIKRFWSFISLNSNVTTLLKRNIYISFLLRILEILKRNCFIKVLQTSAFRCKFFLTENRTLSFLGTSCLSDIGWRQKYHWQKQPLAYVLQSVLKNFAIFIVKHLQLYLKETPTEVFTSEYHEIFNSFLKGFFTEHLWWLLLHWPMSKW